MSKDKEFETSEDSYEATDGTIEDWESINLDPEFEIQEPVGPVVITDTDEALDGCIEDIEALERTIRALRGIRTQETRHFLVRYITYLFIVWTGAGLITFIVTGNNWLLVTDVGPAGLFGVVVYHYFSRPNQGGSDDNQ